MLPKLRRVAWALTRHEVDSLDLLQATVEKALANDAGPREASRLGYWVLRIMKNLWIDEIRRRRRWDRVLTPMPEDGDLSDNGQDMAITEHKIELTQVRHALERLPDEQRLPIQLVLLGELSYAEAAEALEIPIGTLTSRLARGRANLLRTLQEREAS